mgnify:CR=1 FL=1
MASHEVPVGGQPGGTVTLAFTDMEGSTRLLQALGDRYSGVLAEHHRLLRDAFALHGGVERGSAGDGLYFVFPTARSAVLAAVEGQLAIGAHAWPDGIAIRDRMGLHTGEPRAASEGYGLDVHRAARICAAGHGRQILISQTTRSLAAWGGAAHAAGGASAGVTPAPKRGFGAVAGLDAGPRRSARGRRCFRRTKTAESAALSIAAIHSRALWPLDRDWLSTVQGVRAWSAGPNALRSPDPAPISPR